MNKENTNHNQALDRAMVLLPVLVLIMAPVLALVPALVLTAPARFINMS